MAETFHYPPELFELLVETIARLNRAKKGVVLFLRGAGVADEDLAEVERAVTTSPSSINKFEIVRKVLTKVNARGDSGLRPRREIIKRVVEFESFETCWPEDQMKAKGLVASVREAVDAKDSFTRMRQERDAEREATRAHQRAEQAVAADRRAKIEEVNARLAALFGMGDQPHERGKLLESVLNDLFNAYGILIREDFRRKDPDTSTVLEQIDGVIEFDGAVHLVEMKWLNSPVGIGEFFPHLSRLFLRANARGIFISSSGFTEPVVKECAGALAQKTMLLCSLDEIVMLLQRRDDLISFLKKKSHAAIVDKNPFLHILS
ncbi:restriction endonuclease [Paraburkholderia acidicola]|uniref:Restriction endonuclease n=1 Tax=Paraburkholderia acidicola TaxID=1912599 RepID=A0A2A4F8H4_9BURK|nr:restriction endonuclease [Paraburkholderia acidicola]PCE28888.1 restriction endonuclease [Paraburkholderia acidicola]